MTSIIVGLTIVLSVLLIQNSSFTFKIDSNTERAITELSKFSELATDNGTIFQVNYYYDNEEYCLKGCLEAFDRMKGSPNTIGVNDFMRSDCYTICK